jgi:flagellar basal-body rod modification protein FlgD
MAVSPVTTNPTATSALASQPIIAQTFDTFLTLLTTQIKHQNPLDPLDTNQFTQQLVQFAQVEQQISMNSSLATLVTLQRSMQTSAALGFLGSTVVIDGATARLSGGQAAWRFSAAGAGTATITIKSGTGQTAYSGRFTLRAGAQEFVWDGRGNDGVRWPDGAYTISIVAANGSGQPVAVSTEVTGVVDGIDLGQSPPVLWIGEQSFPMDRVKQVLRSGS